MALSSLTWDPFCDTVTHQGVLAEPRHITAPLLTLDLRNATPHSSSRTILDLASLTVTGM